MTPEDMGLFQISPPDNRATMLPKQYPPRVDANYTTPEVG